MNGNDSIRPAVINVCVLSAGSISGCQAIPSIYFMQIKPQPNADPSPAAANIIDTPRLVDEYI